MSSHDSPITGAAGFTGPSDEVQGWIDTHCHLDAPEFDADRASVRAEARAKGVTRLVLPAVCTSHFDDVIRLAQEGGDAYALGLHPLYIEREVPGALERALQARQDDPRLVAVGEIGLDGFVADLDPQRQKEGLEAQLRLARRFNLPVILHVRRSVDAVLGALRRNPVRGGIAHAFNGSRQQAQAFIDLGFKLGFGGAMTFDRALQIRRLAAELPESALVLETDAPDIPPHWLYRTAAERRAEPTDPSGGAVQGRNQPAELPRIAAVLADLRGWTPAQTAAITSANACAALPRLAALT